MENLYKLLRRQAAFSDLQLRKTAVDVNIDFISEGKLRHSFQVLVLLQVPVHE